MDLLQPLLSCKSWDWHGAAAAKVLMCWAGLLSIVGLGEEVHGSDYLCHVPLA